MNSELVELLKSGKDAWNEFYVAKRKSSPDWVADLSNADLTGLTLVGYDLRGANLSGAVLPNMTIDSQLIGANFSGADFSGSTFEGILVGVDLTDAIFDGTQVDCVVVDEDLFEYLKYIDVEFLQEPMILADEDEPPVFNVDPLGLRDAATQAIGKSRGPSF